MPDGCDGIYSGCRESGTEGKNRRREGEGGWASLSSYNVRGSDDRRWADRVDRYSRTDKVTQAVRPPPSC
jgi:hypothetical protein